MNYWLEYQLLSLEFRNGKPVNARRMGFRNALLAFNKPARTVAITRLETPRAEVARLAAEFAGEELMAIRYKIWGYQKSGAAHPAAPPIPYCHPFPKKSHVLLTLNASGQLFLRQADGKEFFSDRFKLAEVSDDTLPSEQPVFQFLET